MDDAPPELRLFASRRRAGWGYVVGAAGVAAVTAVDVLLLDQLGMSSLSLLYLLPVMLASARGGLRPGLATGAMAALAFNFFLIPPRFTLRILNPDHLLTMVLLFAVAAVISELAARLRTAADLAAADAEDSRLLSEFGRRLGDAASRDDVETILCDQLAASFASRVALIEVADSTITVGRSSDGAPALRDLDLAAARWAEANGEITGRGQQTMASAEWLFAPLASAGKTLGVVAIARDDAGQAVTAQRKRLFEGLLVEAAQRIGRLQLAAEASDINALREGDRLRAALLSSVTHDLRTPLTIILGELDQMTGEDAARIRAEARRLDRRIGNLLEMSRIEVGALHPSPSPTDLADAVAGALEDMARELGGRPLAVTIPPELAMVRVDPRLLHHMLINLLDNARKFGSSEIRVDAWRDGAVHLAVADDGPGIPAGMEKAIFERFRQLQGSDRLGGSGLGLGIVAGFAGAIGATVTARNRPERPGAVFTISFAPSLASDLRAGVE